MPIKIPDGLPAAKILVAEDISVIPEIQAFRQNIRPLQIAVLNIMPMKSVTEIHLLRLLGNSPLQVTVTFLHPRSHTSKNTPPEHLTRFYKNFDEIRLPKFDGLIITGAPVETLAFDQVAYWDELRKAMDWSLRNVYSTLHICWGAQAGLHHHYGIRKYPLRQKLFGVFPHRASGHRSPLLNGFDDIFLAPHSRHTDIRRDDIEKVGSINILAESNIAGTYIMSAKDDRQIFITGHPEYDQFTLKEEYERDRAKGLQVPVPMNYFPNDDPARIPAINWRSHANLLFTNWLNLVYQRSPFDLNDLEAAHL